jgi:hypothetical protein
MDDVNDADDEAADNVDEETAVGDAVLVANG